MNQEQLNKNAAAIRLMLTCNVISEYALLKLLDGTKQELKLRVRNSIASCRRVQEYFTAHTDASSETKAIFKQEIMSDEIVLLSELLEICFGMKADSIEEIIKAIKQNTDVVNY